jgi:hypothetical protein
MPKELKRLPVAYGPGFVPITARTFDFAGKETLPKSSKLDIQRTLSLKWAVMKNSLIILAISLSSLLYLSCFWSPTAKLNLVPFAIVNYDIGFDYSTVGNRSIQQRFTTIFKNASVGDRLMQVYFNSSMSTSLAFEMIPATIELADLNDRLSHGEFWGYLQIPASFSNDLLSNARNPSTLQPLLDANNMTLTYRYNQARQMTVTGFVTGVVESIVESISADLVDTILKESESLPNRYQSLLVTPRFLSNPLTLKTVNTHPIPFLGLNFATYIPLVVLWITGILIGSLFNSQFEILEPRLEQKNIIIRVVLMVVGVVLALTLLSSITIYLVLFIMSGFNTTFIADKHSSIELVFYLWLMSLSFTSFSTLFASWMGYDIFVSTVSFLLIIQLSTSSAILDPIVMHEFTRLTFAFPFYYAVQGLRCILLGSQCKNMVLNTVVPSCWLFGMMGLTGLVMYFKATGKILAKMS